jgi:hypothetical protein
MLTTELFIGLRLSKILYKALRVLEKFDTLIAFCSFDKPSVYGKKRKRSKRHSLEEPGDSGGKKRTGDWYSSLCSAKTGAGCLNGEVRIDDVKDLPSLALW